MFQFLLLSWYLKKEKKREVTSEEVVDEYLKIVGAAYLTLFIVAILSIIVWALYTKYN